MKRNIQHTTCNNNNNNNNYHEDDDDKESHDDDDYIRECISVCWHDGAATPGVTLDHNSSDA